MSADGEDAFADAVLLGSLPQPGWDAVASFLARRLLPTAERLESDRYARPTVVDDRVALIAVTRGPADTLWLRGSRDPALVARFARMFDVAADGAAISAALARDPALANMVAPAAAQRVCGSPDPFELAVRAVLGQQVSVAAARTVAGRLVVRFGNEANAPGAEGLRSFPSAARLAALPIHDLRAVGLTHARAETIAGVAAAACAGLFDQPWEREPERLVTELRKLRGIGPWTANYIAMRGFGWRDAFLAEDLLVQRALRVTSARAALRRADVFRPYRAYATLALWKLAPAKPAGPAKSEFSG